LDYAPQPSVGDVTLSRSGGVTVVTRRASLRRVGRALVFPLIYLLTGIAVFALGQVARRHSFLADNGVELAILSLVFVASTLPRVFHACQSIRWQVTTTGIEVQFRGIRQVIYAAYPRARIADVRVERQRIKNQQLFKRPALVAIGPTGTRMILTFGTRAELAFMAEAFRDALVTGTDPLREATLPRPPQDRFSRVATRIGRDNVEVTVRPPVLGRSGLVIIGAAVAGCVVAAYMVVHGSAVTHDESLKPLFVTLAGLGVSVATTLLLSLIYHVRRTITIEVNPAGMHLSERALFRPGRESWPLHRVGLLSVDIDGRRATFTVRLGGIAMPAVQISGQSSDLEYVRDLLAAAIDRIVAPREQTSDDYVDLRPSEKGADPR
jgi:hypothetical protein